MGDMQDRRSEPRRTVISRVEVEWQDPDGAPRHAFAFIEDRSSSGVGMRIPNFIPVGTEIRIKGIRLDVRGVVRQCARAGYEYLVGVKLSAEHGQERQRA